MVLHFYQMTFFLNSSLAVDLIAVANLLVSVVKLFCCFVSCHLLLGGLL